MLYLANNHSSGQYVQPPLPIKNGIVMGMLYNEQLWLLPTPKFMSAPELSNSREREEQVFHDRKLKYSITKLWFTSYILLFYLWRTWGTSVASTYRVSLSGLHLTLISVQTEKDEEISEFYSYFLTTLGEYIWWNHKYRNIGK